jgi:hypothetical protein
MAGNSRPSTSGSGPTEIANVSNWPGSIIPPVHVTVSTTSVSSSPNSSMGSSSVRVVVSTVHPGFGCGRTEPSGWSAGSCTSKVTVPASSRSLGTLNVTMEKPPCSAGSGMLTWADAVPGRATMAMAMAMVAAAARGRRRRSGMGASRFVRARHFPTRAILADP